MRPRLAFLILMLALFQATALAQTPFAEPVAQAATESSAAAASAPEPPPIATVDPAAPAAPTQSRNPFQVTASPPPPARDDDEPPARLEAVLHLIPHAMEGAGGSAPPPLPVDPSALMRNLVQPPNAELPIRSLPASRNTLTNEGLVLLAQAGYDETFLIELMRLKSCRFDTSIDGLAFLARYGLSQRLVRAVLQADIMGCRQ